MPAMSPRTQGMSAAQGLPTSDQAKTLFDQGLSQMAYSVLITKLPSISQDVVTFKILDSDPEEGAGVGAFVVMRRGQTLYIPVVMAENQIKPLDILFYKDLNIFLPLTKEWLGELDKLSLNEMGKGVKQPDTLSTDVDIRNTVIPPTTGRYSYAEEHAGCVFDEAKNQQGPKTADAFLDFLRKAPNRVKTAAARMFETRPKLLKQAVWFYGEQPLMGALKLSSVESAFRMMAAEKCPHCGSDKGAGTNSEGHTVCTACKKKWSGTKEADYGYKVSPGGGLYIADKKTLPGEFASIFGPQAPIAFSGVKVKGYYAKDDRKSVNRALTIQPFVDLQEPKDAGAYKLWQTDGKPLNALIIGNPIDIFADGVGGKRIPPRNMRLKKTTEPMYCHHEVHVDRYVGIGENGKLIDTNELLGSPVAMSHLEDSKVYKKMVTDSEAAGPRAGQTGIFIQRLKGSFVATTPLKVESVTTDSEGVKHYEVMGGWGAKTILVDPKSAGGKLMVPAHSPIVHMPGNFVFIATKGEMTQRDFLTNTRDILHWIGTGLISEGAEKIAVTRPFADSGEDFVDSLRKLATEQNISVEDAEYALKQAQEHRHYSFWVLPTEKYASLAKKFAGEGDAPPSKKKPNEQDQAQAAMDQVAQAQMQQPQGPSPVDMAVAEQMQLLSMQQQSISQQMQMLQNVQTRANMIGGSGGAAANPAAAAAAMGGPMDPSQMGAGAPMQADPSQQGQQGAPGMGQPGAQPGMPPQGQPGAQPADPNQQMAMQQQGGPQAGMPQQGGMQGQPQQQQAPGATMSADDGSVESVMNQVNPSFIEQAGQLQDKGVFDAASLASMAQTPSLKDMVSAYLPNLEKSLDNIGRVLLSLWMDESKIKGDIGDETYIGLEDNLRSTFKGMGDLILKINQNTLVLRGPNDPPMES